MPNVDFVFGYRVFFYSSEGCPLEPVHVHVGTSTNDKRAAKYWILKDGSVVPAKDNSDCSIPSHILRRIEKILTARQKHYVEAWEEHFDTNAQYFNDPEEEPEK